MGCHGPAKTPSTREKIALSVHYQVGAGRDARRTIEARRHIESERSRERVQHPRHDGRHDDAEDRSRSPGPLGPQDFSFEIRGAMFPQRYRPPMMVAKYACDTNPGLWLEDYRLACQAGGTSDDLAIICQLPLDLAN